MPAVTDYGHLEQRSTFGDRLGSSGISVLMSSGIANLGWQRRLLLPCHSERTERLSNHFDAVRFRTLLPRLLGETNPLVLVQRAQSGTLNGPDVDEHVLPTLIGDDEAEALVRVEPLDGAFDRHAAARFGPVAVIVVVTDALARIAGSGSKPAAPLGWSGTSLDAVNGRHLCSLLAVDQVTHQDRSLVQALQAGLLDDRDVKEHVGRSIIR